MSLALLLSVLVTAASAEKSTQTNVPNPSALVFDVLDASKWNKVSSVERFTVSADGGALVVYPETDTKKTSMTFSHTFDSAVTFRGINEVCLEAEVASNYEKFSVKLSVYGENGVYSDTADGICNTKSSVYFKFPEAVKDNIVKLQFTVTAGNEVPDSCSVYSIYADSCYSYSYIELFDTVRFSTLEGNVTYSEKYVTLNLTASSAIEATLAEATAEGGASVVLTVNSSGGGVIYIENLTDSKKYQTALYSGTNDYTFFLDAVPEKIKLGFSHSDGDGSSVIILNSMNVTPLNKNTYGTLGSVSSCVFDGSNVIAKGTVTSDAAVEYISSQLGLFRTSLSGELEAEPIAKIKISTVFEITAKDEKDTANHRYTVAIIADDGIHPLTEPVFASSYGGSSKSYSQTAVGLLNPSSYEAFSANASCVVLDVNAAELLASGNTGDTVTYSHNNTLYSMNVKYFKEIQHDITFYNNLGYSVYLRINVAEQNSYNEHTLKNLCAVLSYIATGCSGISGYVLMPDYQMGDSGPEAASYGAIVLGCLSETVRKISPTAEIYFGVSSDGDLFASHVAHYAKFYGLQGISALYTLDAESKMTSLRASLDCSDFRHVIISAKNSAVSSAIYESASKAGVYAVVTNTTDGFDLEAFKALSGKKDTYGSLLEDAKIKGETALWSFRDSYSTFGFISGGDMSTPRTVETSDGRALRATVNGTSGVLLCRLDSITDLTAASGIAIDFSLTGDEAAEINLIVGYSGSRTIYTKAVSSGTDTLYASLEKGTGIEYIAIAIEGSDGLVIDLSSIRVYSSTLDSTELENAVFPADPIIQRQMTMYYIMGGGALVLTAVIFILLTRKKDEDEDEENEKST